MRTGRVRNSYYCRIRHRELATLESGWAVEARGIMERWGGRTIKVSKQQSQGKGVGPESGQVSAEPQGRAEQGKGLLAPLTKSA